MYLYLLPLGTGQSKGDNSHHWGYPVSCLVLVAGRCEWGHTVVWGLLFCWWLG